MIAPARVEGFVIDRGIGQLGGHAAARGPTDLHGFEPPPRRHAAADLLNDFPQRDAHGHLDEPAAADLAGQGEDLRSPAIARSHRGKLTAAVAEDPGDRGQGLHVVHQGRSIPQSALGRVGRTQAGHAPASLDRGQKRGLFAADKGPGSFLHFQVQAELAAHHRIAQVTPLAAPLEGLANPLDGKRILGPDVEDPLLGRDRACGNGHTLDDPVGKRLEAAFGP